MHVVETMRSAAFVKQFAKPYKTKQFIQLPLLSIVETLIVPEMGIQEILPLVRHIPLCQCRCTCFCEKEVL